MLVVISPAKTLDYAPVAVKTQSSTPDFISESAELIEIMRDKSPADVEKMMHISPKLAELNVARYLNWTADIGHAGDQAKQAILAFKGDVYTGLQAETFSEEDFQFAQDHLRILSGLYGVLKPLDLMQAYRLEMGIKVTNAKGKTLYDFWQDKIAKRLNEQMASLKTATLVNLASNEYFKAVDKKQLDAEIMTPVFKDYKNGKYKIISFYAKKARGLMSAWIIKNRITEKSALVNFDMAGYQFDDSSSKAGELVFLREEQNT